MEKLLFTFEMLQTVAATFPDGFTCDKNTFQPITKGFAVAVAATQNSFDNYGAAKVAAYVCAHEEINAVGGWFNTDNKKYYYDAVIVVNDLETAKRLGRENKQIAIFNLNTLEEIRL
jgi:fructokinase